MPSQTRDLMVRSTVELLRERGYGAMGLREVVARSGAPRGSIYHHFPGGKAELGAEGVRAASALIADGLEPAMRSGDPIQALRAFARGYGAALEASEFRLGCPIAAAANEFTPDAPELARVASETFDQWEAMIAGLLRGAGISRARARRLATLAICSIEGATVMCRAHRDLRPLKAVARELEDAFQDALGAEAARPAA